MSARDPHPPAGAIARDVQVSGIRLHYLTWGEFSRPERAVLLVHGLTASSRTWPLTGARLAEVGWYAIAPDLRGRGLSGKPPHGYGLPFHVNDLLALADTLGIARINYVGHSMGASVGLFLAALHPDRVARLVLVDAGGRIPQDALRTVAATVRRIGQVYPSLEAYLDAMRQGVPFALDDYWEQYFRYDADPRPDGTVTARMPRHALDEELATNGLINSAELPGRVRAPTLIVRAPVGTIGPERGFILPEAEAERMRGLIPNSLHIAVAGTNHYTVVVVPEFTDVLLAFLAQPAAAAQRP
jgi:pimeloyl-ACP methyl ester carboxylesterase